MRYAQGGGLTPRKQAAREQVRLESAERFARGEKTRDIACGLLAGERQAEKWGRTWREGGAKAVEGADVCGAVELLRNGSVSYGSWSAALWCTGGTRSRD